ncbi:MAG: transketolase [Vampirovibrionales bacterium]|nr:transketolase [Vampirovibrionales bacterium]
MTARTLSPSELARDIRRQTLTTIHRAKASHVGSCLSMVDILAVLYARVLHFRPEQPDWPERDRVIVSKGHAAAALYATLALVGFFPESWLSTYCQDGSRLGGHVSYGVPGVEAATGALGHGLSIATGLSLALKRDNSHARSFVILSDGECDEGATWEAALFASHHRLDNLIAIVDYNKIQSFGRVEDVMALEPFADKWRAFGWHAQEVDGHDHASLLGVFEALAVGSQKPTVIIAHTIKGKGVPFMEDDNLWHYKPPNDEQLTLALRFLDHLEKPHA